MTYAAQAPAIATHRVDLARTALGRFRASNARGGSIELGSGDDGNFTPVELLLAALAGCASIDVDTLTGRRSEPTGFDVRVTGEKVRDDHGNHLTAPTVQFTVTFPDGSEGDSAREMLPEAVRLAHERLCTVGRTVELATPVEMRIEPA